MVNMVNNGKKESNALRFKAYKAIKEKIIYLDFKPGEKIFENELAKSLNVSRTPVREALLMLEHEKLVTCNESLGFIVRRFSAKDIGEYFALRNAIEEFVILLVMEKITEEEIAGLKANTAEGERLIREGSDIHTIVRTESEFHELLYRAAKSDILFDTISGLVDKFQWFRALALSVPEAAGSSLSQHKKIIKLIEKKDTEGFKKMMSMHLDEARGRIIGLIDILL
jgi:DNA-binding GntR family transcriptional regulator